MFSSTNDGHVLDVEPGCSTPASAPGWVQRRRKAGVDPTVYCSLSAWPTVRAAFHNAGVAEPHWWVAAYPGNGPNLYPGTVAHQYANPGPVDISVVADIWPGVDTTPTAPTPEVDMVTPAEITAITVGAAEQVWQKYKVRAPDGTLVTLQDALTRLLAAKPATTTAGGVSIDYAALAKAVNDDAAKRLAS